MLTLSVGSSAMPGEANARRGEEERGGGEEEEHFQHSTQRFPQNLNGQLLEEISRYVFKDMYWPKFARRSDVSRRFVDVLLKARFSTKAM